VKYIYLVLKHRILIYRTKMSGKKAKEKVQGDLRSLHSSPSMRTERSSSKSQMGGTRGKCDSENVFLLVKGQVRTPHTHKKHANPSCK